MIPYLAKSVAEAMWAYATSGVKIWAVHKAKAWLSDALNYAVTELFKSPLRYWEGKGSAEFNLALSTILADEKRDLATILAVEVFVKDAAVSYFDKYADLLEKESGAQSAVMEWVIDIRPIPHEQSMMDWATEVGARFGMDPEDVLKRRLGT